MKKLVLAASVLVLGTAAASAADLSPRYYKAPPPMVAAMYDWSGFYAGVNGGWGTSHNCWTRTATLGVGIARAAEGCHDSSGGTVGGQLGYRWQAGTFVFGSTLRLVIRPMSGDRMFELLGFTISEAWLATSDSALVEQAKARKGSTANAKWGRNMRGRYHDAPVEFV